MRSETLPQITATPFKPGDHVVLVDGSGYIFRAFHALPPLARKSDGLPVGAVAGFCNMLWKLLREPIEGATPTHFAVIFDASAVTFRNAIFEGYKAHRPEPPADLIPQFPLIREAVRAFNIACIEQDGFEADDLICTYASLAEAAGATTVIVSSDKDLMQIVGGGILMWDSMKDRRIGREEVIEKFGVPPEKVIEVQALAGDSVDNVPGVPGIGVKTAAQLITEYGDVETLLARAHEIKQPKRRESLIAYAEQARISRRLVSLDCAVPLEHSADEIGVQPIDGPQLISFLRAMEFTTLTRRVAEATKTEAAEIEADPDLKAKPPAPAEAPAPGEGTARATPAGLAAARAADPALKTFDRTKYETVTTLDRLDAWIEEARDLGRVALDTETDGLDGMQCRLIGFSLATRPGRACYVPLRHRSADGFDFGTADIVQIPIDDAMSRLKPLLEDQAVLKIGQNLKFDWQILRREGRTIVTPYDDTMLISYALDAGRGGHGMDDLSRRWLDHTPIPYNEITGTGRKRITFDLVPVDRATAYAAEDADVTLRLWMVLKPRLAAEGMTNVYESLERPLGPVLARMEARGISVDRVVLSRLSGEFAESAGRLETQIHELAGEVFSVASPKQLGDILFGKMQLPGATKTKTGAWGTRANLLEELAEAGHELPRRVIEWRQLTKLKSTYTDALVESIDPDSDRVHTSYALASTSTGRLSSSDPNLQNIPIRTEEGRKIRRAFVAPPGTKLISADYSQIELRVLAHIADIPQLKQAFADGLDIHALTASEMFNVPLKDMDPSIRRRAKAINFGIIYGISAFGLANQLGIPREEARDYIARYFERFPGIRTYMESTKEQCRETGYVMTLFGRRCHYPDIRASNPSMRAFNERAAINAPIQGTAADIIRRAMIKMEPALGEAKLSARMLLQVHDELVFEAPEKECEALLPVIRRVMEEAPLPALSLTVPLAVEARAADNWDDAH